MALGRTGSMPWHIWDPAGLPGLYTVSHPIGERTTKSNVMVRPTGVVEGIAKLFELHTRVGPIAPYRRVGRVLVDSLGI